MLFDIKRWINDIDYVLEVIPELEYIADKSILITGASSSVCSAIVDLLFRYNDTYSSNIHIYAAGRNLKKMKSRFGDRINRDDFTFLPYDATESFYLPDRVDYIIHGASNSSPDKIITEPVETMLSNFWGIKQLLEYSRNHNSRLLYISTSEVYGKKEGNEPYKEGQYGYIDLLNPRNSYSIGKSAAETLCISYVAEYGVEAMIVRLGHIYGPTASMNDKHVSSVWAYNVARGEDIIMKSDGSQIRSYCYCLDSASAILKVLLKGEVSRAYNISNPDSIINIRTMGEILAKAGGVELKVELPSEVEKKGFNPMSNSSLEASSLIDLGWHGCFNAETGLKHTVEILKEMIC